VQTKGINISILGRDFSVACPPEEQEDLLEAARYLDNTMRKIQKSGKIIGTERVAIMAALNIADDLLKIQKSTADQTRVTQRLERLQSRIDDVLKESDGF
jgi:cell division protein ZapA